MTLAEPRLLLALALVPLVALAYLLSARQGRGRVAAAATPGLWPNLMPRRPGWRRHVAPALSALAIGLLLVGLARPQLALSQDLRETTVVLRLGDAIDRAVASLKSANAPAQGRAIVVISDGKSTEGQTAPLAAARAAKVAGVRVFTVSLGTASGVVQQGSKQVAVPPDPTTLQRAASLTGGRFYRAADAASLRSAYRQIGGAVRPGRKRQDVSFAFVAGAGALAVAGSLLSLVWFRRLI